MRTYLRLMVVAAVTGVGVAGCAEPGALARFREEAAMASDRLRREADALEWRAGHVPGEAGEGARTAAAEARKLAQTGDRASEAARLAMEENGIPHPLGGLLEALVPFVPEPYRAPLVLGGAGVLALARAARLKAGLASVARSIEKAMEGDPVLAEQFRRHADTLRSIQTPLARKVVDEVTSGRRCFPI